MFPRFLITSFFGLIIVIGLIVYFNNSSSQTLLKPTTEKIEAIVASSPTPMPFAELTVPYLREKRYESSLGELAKVSENSNYTSYLTSFTSDGLKINAQLTQPKGEMPQGGWSAVIFIHGYIPPVNYQTLGNYSSFVDFLAKEDLVIFKIDLRGHGSSEGEAGGGYYSSDYIIDTLNAHAALQKTEFVNPEKIGLWGHSMAGNVVLRSLAAKPEIPAAVIWAGAGFSYLDLSEFGIDDNSYRPPPNDSERQRKRELLFETHGRFDPDSEFWKKVTPTNYLNDLKSAIQLHHAINDEVVSVEYSRNLKNLLDQTLVPHELHEYQSGGHNLTGNSFTQAMQKTVDFFSTHLK